MYDKRTMSGFVNAYRTGSIITWQLAIQQIIDIKQQCEGQ